VVGVPPTPAAATSVAATPVVLASRLRVAMIRIGRRLRHQDPPGLSATQHLALVTVARRGELAIGDLAELEHLPSSAATRVADRLEEAGLVFRARDPNDRRGVRLALTDEGRRVVEEHARLGNAWLARRLALLDETQLASLAAAVDVLESVVLTDRTIPAVAGEPESLDR